MILTVVIPTFNRLDLLRNCLEATERSARRCRSAPTVIVANDGERGAPASALGGDFPWAVWVDGPRRGPAANRNAGARVASSDWLVFLDDDCIPDEQWLPSLEATCEGQLDVVEGRTYANRPRARCDEVSPLNEHGGVLWSCNLAIRTGFFWSLGGFDEAFRHAAMEDVDLRERIHASRGRIAFNPNASVCHPWRRVDGRVAFNRVSESTRVYLRKHPPSSSVTNIGVNLLRSTKHSLSDLVRFRGRGAAAVGWNLLLAANIARLEVGASRDSGSRMDCRGG